MIPMPLPYFHPTTIAVIDDDPVFLGTLARRLRRHGRLCAPFTEGEAALRHLRAIPSAALLHEACLVDEAGVIATDWESTDRTLTFRLGRLRNLIRNPARFGAVSVAIIDYEMPDMDGLEVCRQLRDLPVKRLILTGKADERLAKSALNEGLIDGFLLKQDQDLARQLPVLVDRLQADYFARLTEPLRPALPAFLADPAVQRYARAALDQAGAVEHYLSAIPPGLLMARADGTLLALLVQDDAALTEHRHMAHDSGTAPHSLIDALAAPGRQPWFPTASGYYDLSCLAWERFLHPAERVGAWWCSVITADPAALGLPPIRAWDTGRRRRAGTP